MLSQSTLVISVVMEVVMTIVRSKRHLLSACLSSPHPILTVISPSPLTDRIKELKDEPYSIEEAEQGDSPVACLRARAHTCTHA